MVAQTGKSSTRRLRKEDQEFKASLGYIAKFQANLNFLARL
jgi:hypothetical protein